MLKISEKESIIELTMKIFESYEVYRRSLNKKAAN